MDIPADKNTVQALIHRFKEAGVHFVDDARVYLDPSVTIEDGAVIWPNVVLRGRTHIAAQAEIQSGCWLQDTVVGRSAVVKPHCVCEVRTSVPTRRWVQWPISEQVRYWKKRSRLETLWR